MTFARIARDRFAASAIRLIGLGLALLLAGAEPVQAASAELPSERDLTIARDAFRAADRGQWGKALSLAAGAADKLTLKILQWIDLQRPQAGHDFSEIAAFVDANPDWPHQSALRLRAEETMAAVPDARLRQWFERHSPVSPAAKLRKADILAASGRTAEAVQIVRNVWIEDDFSAQDERQFLTRYADALQPGDHLRRLDRLLWEGKAGDAERLFGRVPPEQKRLALARIKLAASAAGAEAAVAEVPQELQADPGLLYERMRWRRRNGMDDAAADIMEHAKELGRPEAWWPDRQILARRLLQQDQAARAYRLMAGHHLGDGPALAEAEFTAGWIALRFLKDPDKAYAHFARLYDTAKLPLTLSRGAYWAGRAADAMRQPALALGWYEKAAKYTTTYYGQLAAAMPDVPAAGRPVPEPKASPQEAAAFNRRELVRVARLLAALDEQDRIRPFVSRLSEMAESPSEHALVADLAEEIGRPDLGVMAAKKASYTGVSLLRAGYPIVPMPRNAGAEQALLLALTRQESAFDVRAVSASGARGLMQLMPATASQVARSLAIPFKEQRLTGDGAYNVTLGQAYLDTLLGRFNGSYVLAIAAYNAGPARVRQWLDDFGDPRSPEVDAVDWIEEIPYGETRNYVQRVLENLQVYRLRIGNRSLAFSLQADLRR